MRKGCREAADEQDSSQPIQNHPSTSSVTGSASSLPHAILEGTSLASFATTNNERRVIFQDQSGLVREAMYQDNAEWTAPTSNVITTNARNKTPLAAFNLPQSATNTIPHPSLFYANTDGNMAIRFFEEGAWMDADPVTFANSSHLVVNPSTRTFSATFIQPSASDIGIVVVVFDDGNKNYNAVYNNNYRDNTTWTDAGLFGMSLSDFKFQIPFTQCAGATANNQTAIQILSSLLRGGIRSVVLLEENGNEISAGDPLILDRKSDPLILVVDVLIIRPIQSLNTRDDTTPAVLC